MNKFTDIIETIGAITLLILIIALSWLLLGWVILGAVEVWQMILGVIF